LARSSFPVEMEIRDVMQKIALAFPAYGYRRITAELNRRGFAVNHKRVLRLMRQDNLLCLRRKSFVVTTDSRHSRGCIRTWRVTSNPAGSINSGWPI
jgi:transposase InsO family protein